MSNDAGLIGDFSVNTFKTTHLEKCINHPHLHHDTLDVLHSRRSSSLNIWIRCRVYELHRALDGGGPNTAL